MADGLQGVLDDMKAAIIAAAAPSTVSVEIGYDKIAEAQSKAPPAIVLYATDERSVSGHPPSRTRARSNPAVARFQRKVTVILWCWGDATRASPYGPTDALVNTAMAAIDKAAYGNFNFEAIDGRWTLSDESVRGAVNEWRLELYLPVTYPTHATATITQFDNDAGTSTPESDGIYPS